MTLEAEAVKVLFASCKDLGTVNSMGNIVFQISFWYTVLSANEMVASKIKKVQKCDLNRCPIYSVQLNSKLLQALVWMALYHTLPNTATQKINPDLFIYIT